MQLEELVAAVLELPVSELNDQVSPSTHGGWTSLKHLQLAVAIQDNYSLVLSADEIRGLTSVGLIRRLLESKGVAL